MEVKVQLNNLRTAPRKVRQVADLIRNKRADKAQQMLAFTVNKSSTAVLKLLNSAIASAVNDLKLKESNLFVSRIMVDEGPKLKRSHPMSRGRAYPIMKRTSHVTLILGEVVASPAKQKAKPEAKAEKVETKEIKAKKLAPKVKKVKVVKEAK